MAAAEGRARKPLEHVLVPTDFSENAARALQRALLLPLAPKARLHILHVLPKRLPAKARPRVEAEARRALEEAVSTAKAGARKRGLAGLEITSELLFGEPFVEIIRSSRSIEAELIVIGRHGRSPIRDLFIGTTAERVIRKGDVPILVVKLEAARPYARPLLAVELDDTARRLLSVMLRVLGPKASSATLVHAFNVPFEEFIAPNYPVRERSEYRKACKAEAVAGVTKFLSSISKLGLRWRVAVRPGDARTVILAEALRQRTDLISVGTHARSGIAHALLGSIAEWTVASAPCDVLVARPVRFSFELP
jgi:nucleotide-binding universal stress UspA family protein